MRPPTAQTKREHSRRRRSPSPPRNSTLTTRLPRDGGARSNPPSISCKRKKLFASDSDHARSERSPRSPNSRSRLSNYLRKHPTLNRKTNPFPWKLLSSRAQRQACERNICPGANRGSWSGPFRFLTGCESHRGERPGLKRGLFSWVYIGGRDCVGVVVPCADRPFLAGQPSEYARQVSLLPGVAPSSGTGPGTFAVLGEGPGSMVCGARSGAGNVAASWTAGRRTEGGRFLVGELQTAGKSDR